MDILMDTLNSAKAALITAAIGDRMISTTAFKRPMVTEYEDYYEVIDEAGNEILFEKDFTEIQKDGDKDCIVKYGVVDYYITPL